LIAHTSFLTLLIATAFFAAYMVMVIPAKTAEHAKIQGDAGSIDITFGNRPADVLAKAEAYGPAGREAMIESHLVFDGFFPLAYGGFLVTAIAWLSGRAFVLDSRWRQLTLVPLFAMLFDYTENLSIVVLMMIYDSANAELVRLAWLVSAANLLKWLFVYGSFLVLAIVLIPWVWKLVKRGSAPAGTIS
jgi:hypothetical protein